MKINEKTKLQIKEEGGVTLVALIVSIVLLVIVAATTISSLYDSKITEYAINSAEAYNNEAIKENQIFMSAEEIIESTLARLDEIVANENEVNI